MPGVFTVYYHEGFSGRAQPLEMMLAATKQTWKRAPFSSLEDPTVFACPAVGHDQSGKVVSQTAAAAQWLGDVLFLAPPTSLKPEAMKVALDLADIWSEIYGKRRDAKTWGDIEAFLGGRLAKWFAVLEACVAKWGNGFVFGGKPTYVDFLLLNVVTTSEFLVGKARMAPLLGASPKVAAVVSATLALPGVKECKESLPELYGSVAEGGKMPFRS